MKLLVSYNCSNLKNVKDSVSFCFAVVNSQIFLTKNLLNLNIITYRDLIVNIYNYNEESGT